jgi:GNAT superfamily N-acetyltransferase
MSPEVDLRGGTLRDAPACAAILQTWLDGTDWMPDLHALDDTLGWMRAELFASCEVTVAEAQGLVCGYIACEPARIVSFTVAEGWRGQGIGARLLDHAKAAHPAGLTLWTFEANAGARRFYARHGFADLRRTRGENEEGLPDVLMGWPADA